MQSDTRSEAPNGAFHPFQKIPGAVREVGITAQQMIRSELRLATAEMKTTARELGRRSALGLTFAVIAVLGLFPLMAFLVIGLGRIINDNFWLSSLIIGVVMIAVGSAVAWMAFRRISRDDFALPRTKRVFDEDVEHMTEGVGHLTDVSKRRSA